MNAAQGLQALPTAQALAKAAQPGLPVALAGRVPVMHADCSGMPAVLA